MEDRPNQLLAESETADALRAGAKRVCVTSPCGGGKTRMMTNRTENAVGEGTNVSIYTMRRMLFDQTAAVFEKAGIDFGRRASGHELALLRQVQICMTQTELSQVYRQQARELHGGLALIDEAHLQKSDSMAQIMQAHIEGGGACVGYTATPLDIGHLYDQLIVAGTNSELRKIGALVLATHYAPDEPDLRHIKNYVIGNDLTERENRKAIMRPGVFGRIVKSYRQHNPEQLPTVCFAPDVKGSLFFAEQFTKEGIRAAHIDGDDVWVDGEFHNSAPETREWIMKRAKNGDIKVLCNRFVLRVGWDAPWLCCGILACVFGSLTSYLQSAGRLLRAYPGKEGAILIDHGGSWWRHGSVNTDREWNIADTNHRVVAERAERMREKKEVEPITCPNCGMVRKAGIKECPQCGHVSHIKSRHVVQIDGTLKEMTGDIFKPRVTRMKPDTQKKWERMYHRMKRCGRTFRQAEALFLVEEHYWPPRNLPLMPKNSVDWFRKVNEIPREALL